MTLFNFKIKEPWQIIAKALVDGNYPKSNISSYILSRFTKPAKRGATPRSCLASALYCLPGLSQQAEAESGINQSYPILTRLALVIENFIL